MTGRASHSGHRTQPGRGQARKDVGARSLIGRCTAAGTDSSPSTSVPSESGQNHKSRHVFSQQSVGSAAKSLDRPSNVLSAARLSLAFSRGLTSMQ